MSVYAYTSCTFSYLNRARVLAKTIKKFHPDWIVCCVLVDDAPPNFKFGSADEQFDHMFNVKEVYNYDVQSWLFQHDIVEACTAVKGQAALYLMARPNCNKVIYFDPDIAIFNKMSEVVDLLDKFSIILTPHQVDFENSQDIVAIRDNEVASLAYGVFNLGFVAIANDQEGLKFACWWRDRLQEWCHDKVEDGLFVDQKWCNLVPCFFERVKILRDPGYNVASWNLSKRKMSYDSVGNALINKSPLKFFHFTKLGAVGDAMTRRYAKENIEVYELWWWYKQQVDANSDNNIPRGWWVYGKFSNDVVISKSIRELYRNSLDLREQFPKPRMVGVGSFYEWLGKETDLLVTLDTRGFQPV